MAAMRHWMFVALALCACDRGAAVGPPGVDAALEAGPVDRGAPPPDAVLDAALLDVGLDMWPRDAAPRDAEVDMEPFEVGPPPYSLDAAVDPSTLELSVVQDWVPVLNGTAFQKRAEMTLDVLPSGRKLRVPLLYVAPAQGCPCNFFVVDGGFTPEVRAIDSVVESLLAVRVGMVAVGIAPLADLGPDGEAAAAELQILFERTGNLRYTELWLWGYAYMRAATAALTELDRFSPNRIGAAGRSRGGLGATTAVIQDPRFVALSAWLTPLAQLPPDVLPEGLTGRARRRVKFDAQQMSLPILHTEALDQRRVDLFFHNASNDLQTPGLLEAGRLDREFPMCIEPNVGHGVVFRPQGAPVPVAQPFQDTRLAVLEFSLSRGSRLMTPPLLSATVVGDTMTVLARFRTVPRPDNATLWFTYDRAPDSERAYEDAVWQNVPMSRLDNSTFVVTLPTPPAGVRAVDAFSYHTDVAVGRPRAVSSAYSRFTLVDE